MCVCVCVEYFYFEPHDDDDKMTKWGQDPRTFENRGGRPPQKFGYFSIFFLETFTNFTFSKVFKTKWRKSEEKLNFGGRWVLVPMNPTPRNQNFGATPLPLVDISRIL